MKLKKKWGLYFIALSSISIALLSTTYLDFGVKGILNSKSANLLANPMYRGLFIAHVLGGIMAITSGPWQLIHKTKWHKILGRIYAFGVLVGGISGLIIGFFTFGGVISQSGLITLSLVWLAVTWKAISTIRQRNITAHRFWILQSFALTYAAFTFRMILLTNPIFGWDFEMVYHFACWIWVLNWIVVRYYIYWYPEPRSDYFQIHESKSPIKTLQEKQSKSRVHSGWKDYHSYPDYHRR